MLTVTAPFSGLISDEDVYSFYTALIPEDVCDSKSFEAWRRRAEREDPQSMLMDPESLARGRLPEGAERDFPDALEFEQRALALVYRFDPGRGDDGVTLEIPLELLSRIKAETLEWLVPGLLGEKVLAMLKLLPKVSRRELLPLAECARQFMDEGARGSGTLANALREFLRSRRGVEVPADAWRRERVHAKLAPHLLMNVRVLGADASVLGEGRDLLRLQARLAPASETRAETTRRSGYVREGLRDWVVDTIPAVVEEHVDGRLVRGYPALADRGESVALDLFASAEAAAQAHAAGVRRLYILGASRELRRRLRKLPNLDNLELLHAMLPPAPDYLDCEALPAESMGRAILDRAVEAAMPGAAEIRDLASYRQAAAAADATLWPGAESLAELVHRLLETQRALTARMRELGDLVPAASLADIEEHMAHLLFRGFVLGTPCEALENYPRYLEALRLRLDKLARGGAGDERKLAAVAPLWNRFTARAAEHASRARKDTELERYRWMLEEYRVSLFAQELGTAYRISRKRLDAQWRKVSL